MTSWNASNAKNGLKSANHGTRKNTTSFMRRNNSVMSRLLAVTAIAVGLLGATTPSPAHHSGSLYDRERPVTLTGTVTAWELVMPHARVFFDVKGDNGVTTKWESEER